MTRRSILSAVASVYDPLGFLAPIVLVGKRILQQLCQQDWDGPVPDALEKRWIKWKTDLFALSDIKISRCYKPTDFGQVVHAELHHFSDASTTGYSQCSYIRQIDDKSTVLLFWLRLKWYQRRLSQFPGWSFQRQSCQSRFHSSSRRR